MPSYCISSPNQQHCYCTRMDGGDIGGPYWSVIPPALKCCWCGASNMAEHGPYRGGPRPWWPYTFPGTFPGPGYTNPSPNTTPWYPNTNGPGTADPLPETHWSTCNRTLTRTFR